jgi:hypothetical protein
VELEVNVEVGSGQKNGNVTGSEVGSGEEVRGEVERDMG